MYAHYDKRKAMRKAGTYEKIGDFDFFCPYPLPPKNPPLTLSPATMELHGKAMYALGALDARAKHLPAEQRFIKAYIIKEALLSSSIEGIHTTLVNVFTQPLLETRPDKNTQLVINYTKALEASLSLIQTEGLPLANRVILAAHKALMSYGEGDKYNPGNFRKQSVRVGNLVPAPAPQVPQLMKELEQFINEPAPISPLIASGLVHVQFETIHPFLDGNGRIGRLLIVLMLIQSQLLHTPILYPSYFFKKYQNEYYFRLDQVRLKGDFEGWITFYLSIIEQSSIDALKRAQDIEALREKVINTIKEMSLSASQKELRLKTLSILFQLPVINAKELSEQLGVAYNTARSIIDSFIASTILVNVDHKKRGSLYTFQKYIEILEKEYV